jgi:hypothetical protein
LTEGRRLAIGPFANRKFAGANEAMGQFADFSFVLMYAVRNSDTTISTEQIIVSQSNTTALERQ